MESITALTEDFKSYVITAFTLLLLAIFVGYLIYMSRLNQRECGHMNTLYPSVNGNLRAIQEGDEDCQHALYDYYIKTAYNACSGGAYKNDFVDVCNLKAVIKQGARCLDFEIYSIDNEPVVSTSSIVDNYHVKETFNAVPFTEVMSIIRNYAPNSTGTCPNSTDPMIIHLRCKSANAAMYAALAGICKANTDILLGPEYSYELEGKNIGVVPLLNLRGKVLLFMDRSNPKFQENEELMEYVNAATNSVFVREYDFYGVKNNPDMSELVEFNKQGMTIVLPDRGPNPSNPSGIVCRADGCQITAMRYQYVDDNLTEMALFFDRSSYAFALKPEELRYHPVTVDMPTPQNPEYSYVTRTAESDYYKFQF